MNYLRTFFWLSAGVYTLYTAIKSSKEERDSTRRLSRKLEAAGFQVSSPDPSHPDEVLRFRGSYENLLQLTDPEKASQKPPLPAGLDIEHLPSYFGGCPHCGAMSLYGENQWRYQELSRTRGLMDNTTTYLALCCKCDQFMKCTVDHDD